MFYNVSTSMLMDSLISVLQSFIALLDSCLSKKGSKTLLYMQTFKKMKTNSLSHSTWLFFEFFHVHKFQISLFWRPIQCGRQNILFINPLNICTMIRPITVCPLNALNSSLYVCTGLPLLLKPLVLSILSSISKNIIFVIPSQHI